MSAMPHGPGRPVAESIRLQLGTDALVLITPGPHSCAVVVSSVPGYPSRLTDARTELDRESADDGPRLAYTVTQAARAADDVHARCQRTIRQADPRRSSLPRRRRAIARQAALLTPIVGDIPMRYTITISRVQTATRYVRAASEEDARKKIEDELSRPYGFLGAWQTVAQDLDLVAIESPLGDQPLPDHAALKDEGGFVLSIKATARFLGVPEATVRKLVNDGDMKHVRFGHRIYITRDQIN